MSETKSILVVEDEPKIREGLQDFLEFQDFKVSVAEDGLEAERLVNENTFDLILLDLMLPKISGEQLCQGWRQKGVTTPIIMLTAKGQESEKINGLNLGADDYVTKPFSLEELLARIRAILRRVDPERSVSNNFAFGPFTVDVNKMILVQHGIEVPLSVRQARILQHFAAHPDQVISRDDLYRTVWNESMSAIETRTVDMHIAKLRSLLEEQSGHPDLIQTVRGVGYMYVSGHGAKT